MEPDFYCLHLLLKNKSSGIRPLKVANKAATVMKDFYYLFDMENSNYPTEDFTSVSPVDFRLIMINNFMLFHRQFNLKRSILAHAGKLFWHGYMLSINKCAQTYTCVNNVWLMECFNQLVS